MIPDEPTPDAPSPLQRALRWSLPGAALLSVPVTLILTRGWSLPWSVTQIFQNHPLAVTAVFAVFGIVVLWTSSKAIVVCFRFRCSSVILAALVVFLNLAALLASCQAIVLLISGRFWV